VIRLGFAGRWLRESANELDVSRFRATGLAPGPILAGPARRSPVPGVPAFGGTDEMEPG
jgi:hypothetical protein